MEKIKKCQIKWRVKDCQMAGYGFRRIHYCQMKVQNRNPLPRPELLLQGCLVQAVQGSNPLGYNPSGIDNTKPRNIQFDLRCNLNKKEKRKLIFIYFL